MKIAKENIPVFSLEDFMKSITYPPEGMTTNLARKQVTADGIQQNNILDREMEILKRALELLPIGIGDEDVIAGNYGSQFASPELISQIAQADADEYNNSEEYKIYSEDEYMISGRYLLFGIYTPSHICLDYETIISKGLKAYEKRIDDRLMRPIDFYGRNYLLAMKKGIRISQSYAMRFHNLAVKKLETCQDEKQRTNLKRMIHALGRVPYEPAEDLFEALQSIFLIHTIVPTAERSWASVSFGRTDQYLLPYYEKWIADGNTREDAKFLLMEFFKTFDKYGDGSCAMNLGPEYNEMTKLLLEVEKSVRLRAPIIATRMKSDSDDFYDDLVNRTLFEIGQPTFYSEPSCKAAMTYRGMLNEQDYSINSCMGEVIVGKELADMWGCCVNMNLALELSVNKGKPFSGELPESLNIYFKDVIPMEPTSMEIIKAQYYRYTQCIVRYVTDLNKKRSAWVAWNRPNPVLSMLLDDCIEYGRDRAHASIHSMGMEAKEWLKIPDEQFEAVRSGRGVKYHNVTVLAQGFADAGDSLEVIKKLVFEEKKYTLEDLIQATIYNFEGSKRNLEIFSAVKNCPKYADGSDDTDDMAAFVLNALADAAENCYHGNVRYLPTCHTIDSNVQFGRCVYANLDGRKDGEAFGKNAGPVMQVIKNTPTDLMTSALHLPQYRFSGGVPIDIYIPANILDDEEGRAKVKGLLKVYLENGGMQVQVNSVSLDLLKKAYENPEEYPNVIVRKGGFSIYFTDMLKEVQKDMIERFEKEIS